MLFMYVIAGTADASANGQQCTCESALDDVQASYFKDLDETKGFEHHAAKLLTVEQV